MPITFTLDPAMGGFATDTLKDVREQFVKASSRYDLIANGDISTNVDNGANYFINVGQRWLDQRVDPPQLRRVWLGVLESGEYKVSVPHLLSIESLTISNETSGTRSDITKNRYSRAQLRHVVGSTISEWSSDEPTYWCPNIIGLAPSQFGSTKGELEADGQFDIDDLHFENDPDFYYDGILFYPKADTTYKVEVAGRFYSKFLSEDTDVSFWTTKDPDLLVLAACMIHEMRMGNAQRVAAWKQAIDIRLDDFDSAIVEAEMSGLDLTLES